VPSTWLVVSLGALSRPCCEVDRTGCPEEALSDGPQALLPEQFDVLMRDIKKLAEFFHKTLA